MQKHYNYLTIDLDRKIHTKLKSKQGDSKSRYILVNLISNSTYYNLTGTTVKIYGIKKDKTIFFNHATIIDAKNGQFEIELTTQALAVVGEIEIQILILGTDDEKLTTFSFFIDVNKTIIDDTAIESTNEFTALTTALSSVQNIDNRFAEVDEQFNTIKTYVTLEEFGAKGDGLTDDSIALQNAINTCLPIKCKLGKKYLINSLIKATNELNINGNWCTFINLKLHMNINEEGSDWNVAYSKVRNSFSKIRFENTNRDCAIFTGCAVKLEDIEINGYNNFLKTVDRYIDYMTFKNVNISNKYGTDFTFNLLGLGDARTFEKVHIYGSSDNKVLHITMGNSVKILQSLNGEYSFRDCNVNISTSHFETLGLANTRSQIVFDSCYFWVSQIPSYNKLNTFKNCIFMCNPQTYAPFNITTIKGENNKLIYSSNVVYETVIDLDKYNRDTVMFTYSNVETTPSQSTSGISSSNMAIDTNTRYYKCYQSISNDFIDNGKYDYSVIEKVITPKQNTSIIFNISSTYTDAYLHFYKKTSEGKYYKAVVIPSDNLKVYDTGTEINGVPWTEVSSYPTVVNSNAQLINNICWVQNLTNFNGSNIFAWDSSTGNLKYVTK